MAEIAAFLAHKNAAITGVAPVPFPGYEVLVSLRKPEPLTKFNAALAGSVIVFRGRV